MTISTEPEHTEIENPFWSETDSSTEMSDFDEINIEAYDTQKKQKNSSSQNWERERDHASLMEYQRKE